MRTIKHLVACSLFCYCLAGTRCTLKTTHLPCGGVALSFDDYFVDNWYAYEPMLHEYGAKVTFYVCCWHDMTPEQKHKLLKLQQAGHEIAFHGCNHSNAQTMLAGMSVKQYLNSEIFPDLNSMKAYGLRVTNFAYPYGSYTQTSDSALQNIFHSLRKTTINSWYNSADWFSKAVFTNFDHSGSFYAASIDKIGNVNLPGLIKAMDFAVKNKKVLLIFGHYLSTATGDYFTTPDLLRTILQEVKKRNLRFYRTEDLVTSCYPSHILRNR